MKSRKLNYYSVAEHPYLSSAVSAFCLPPLSGVGATAAATAATTTPATTNYYYLPSAFYRSSTETMPPADELTAERKLFVGMLAKKCNESDVRNMFSSFGTIEECTVLRDTSGQSKGCAFVTYASKQSAIAAIKAMHHSQTMDGCNSPLVTKFADTQKEKDQKKLHQMQASLWSLTGASLTPSYLSSDPATCLAPAGVQLLQHLAGGANTPTPGSVAPSLQSLQQQLMLQSALQNQQSLGLNLSGSPTPSSPDLTAAANLQNLATIANLSVASPAVNPMSVQNLVTLAAIQGNTSNLQMSQSALTNLTGSSNGLSSSLLGKVHSKPGSLGGSTTGASPLSPVTLGSSLASLASHNGMTSATLPGLHTLSSGAAGKQIEGPDGANLFIYHLPPEFTDSDLALTFHSFGNVISAKVFIDKVTNLSKCFGFVSYDNALSAQSAIQAMNGFQIGMKRLKVQLKRSKEASRPY